MRQKAAELSVVRSNLPPRPQFTLYKRHSLGVGEGALVLGERPPALETEMALTLSSAIHQIKPRPAPRLLKRACTTSAFRCSLPSLALNCSPFPLSGHLVRYSLALLKTLLWCLYVTSPGKATNWKQDHRISECEQRNESQ